MEKGRKNHIFVKSELREKRDAGRVGWECAHLRKPSQPRLQEELAQCSRRGRVLKPICEGLQQSLVMEEEIGQTSGIGAWKLCYQLGD